MSHFSSEFIAALRAERGRLLGERSALEQRIGQIDAMIGPSASVPLVSRQSSRAIIVRDNPALFPSEEPESDQALDGLRAALRKALESGPKSPGEAIAAVKEMGYSAPGKTPLETRVYNELGRMRKGGLVTRDEDRRYRLVA